MHALNIKNASFMDALVVADAISHLVMPKLVDNLQNLGQVQLEW